MMDERGTRKEEESTRGIRIGFLMGKEGRIDGGRMGGGGEVEVRERERERS